jgi:hypothetical protein
MGGDRMSGTPFFASFTARSYDKIDIQYKESAGIQDRPFYVSLGPVTAWFTLEEMDMLHREATIALLTYDEENNVSEGLTS